MKARISLRVSLHLWDVDQRRRELLRLLRDYRGVIDEVALFTGVTHTPRPLAEVRRLAGKLGRVLPEFAALGLSCGINHLATIGHLDEDLEHSLREPWQGMVDIGGGVSRGCYCAADPGMRQYIRDCYVALARARPQFLWVDDDVRMEWHGPSVRYGCFCRRCLAGFSKQTGKRWTRKSLEAAFCGGDAEGRIALRRAWLEHNRGYLEGIFRLIRSAIDEVDPAIELGYMDCEVPYSGDGQERWAAALAGQPPRPVKWRPGSGVYTDHVPLDALAKAHRIGRLAALVSPTVTDIQSEHENFPYQMLAKSAAVFSAEIGGAIAAGCTGTALNIMGITPDPIEEYRPRFDAVRDRRRFYDRLVGTFERRPALGIWPAGTADHFAFRAPAGDWFGDGGFHPTIATFRELSDIGLPLAYSRGGAAVVLLAGTSPREFSPDELTEILSGGVLMDGPALACLCEMGLGDLTGFRVAGTKQTDTQERFTNDPLNGRFRGYGRDCRPSFWPQTTWLLDPLSRASRVLAEAIDFVPTRLGHCMGVFENRLGGRVAVLGYYPWQSLQSLAKASQLKNLVRWISRGRLACVRSFHKVAIWHRSDALGRPAAALLNVSLDEARDVEVSLPRAVGTYAAIRSDGATQTLVPTVIGRQGILRLDRLAPWDMMLLAPISRR
jgi:hypothetical protein